MNVIILLKRDSGCLAENCYEAFHALCSGIDPDPRYIISIGNTAFTRYRYSFRKVE